MAKRKKKKDKGAYITIWDVCPFLIERIVCVFLDRTQAKLLCILITI